MDEEVELNRNMNETEKKKKKNDDDRSKEVFRWELFLPKITVNVMLVESDRSTRRLITSLLMNCNYKVIAVSDGIKAWKLLQMKEIDIDLVLTEMELPALSGLALLSLMMEYETCKNIPLIMMSSHDSRSMVMNCMCKGAADFLIKPVRKNELTNLWQHVWRKHVLNRPLQNTSAQEKLKIAIELEDNLIVNRSTDSVSVASSQINNECSEKLSEAQSTRALPFSDAENAYMDDMQNTSQMKSCFKLSEIDVLKHEESNQLVRESTKQNDEARGSRLEQDYNTSEVEPKNEIFKAELSRENPDTKMRGCNDELIEPFSKAIDLISTVGNLRKCTKEIHCINGDEETKFDFEKELELSLRSEFSGSSQANEATEEWQRLNHSNTSAFSQYNGSKMLWPLFQNSNLNSNTSHELSGVTADNCIQYGGPIKRENMTNAVMAHYGKFGPKLFDTGLLADNIFHHMLTPKSNCQKESSPFPSSSPLQSNPESYNSDHHHNCSYDANCSFLNQNVAEQIDLDHVVHDSPSGGQGFGNDICRASNRINSSNDESATSTVVTKNSRSSSDCRHYKKDYYDYDEEFRLSDLSDSHRSCQREAALARFRSKRKERCYEKKVRYQSRKRVAEQRLRVKGQFVRRVHNDDHPNADASGDQ